VNKTSRFVRFAVLSIVVAIAIPAVHPVRAATPDPNVDPATGQLYGLTHPRWSHLFHWGDNATPHTYTVSLAQGVCDTLKQHIPSFVQNGPCVGAETVQETVTSASSGALEVPQDVIITDRGRGHGIPSTFAGQRQYFQRGLQDAHLMWDCPGGSGNYCSYEGIISTETPPGNAWSATDNEQFAQWWDGSQYWVYSHSGVDCSQWRGSPGNTVSITWCGVGSGDGSYGNPSNAIWMDAGENFTVTTCNFLGQACANQGHGQRTRFYADREYSISSW